MADDALQKYMSTNFSESAQTKQMKFYFTDAKVMNTNLISLVHIFSEII